VEADVAYIITNQERYAFDHLSSDVEREEFIEQFWLRRDPTPGTEKNEFKEEHYRRTAYANQRFASSIPGWKTDRGRVYIVYGPPDAIDLHPTGELYQRPLKEGGGPASTYPLEHWRYRFLEAIGNHVVFEFVDCTNSGEYRLLVDPPDKDTLANLRGVPSSTANCAFLDQVGVLDVSHSDEEKLQASSLILTDVLEHLPVKNISGAFTIGNTKIRPRPSATFGSDEKLGIYIQLYHFMLDPVSHKPNGSIQYQVVSNESHQALLDYTETVSLMPGATSQVVVEKLLPLMSLAPGRYTLKLRATDNTRNQTITPSADFTIIPAAPR
jgi:GWxTD domain-containing protein